MNLSKVLAAPPYLNPTLFKLAAPVFCFLIGTILLVVVLGPGDGFWQLHAELMLKGHRLYSDLGINQQPLYFILSMLSFEYAPNTILGQRIISLVILALYVYVIYLISTSVSKSPVEAAVLQLAVFFTAIYQPFFRFDDYHAPTRLGLLISLYLSILFISGRQRLPAYALCQVLIATLVFLIRINEALAIVASVGLIVLVKNGFTRNLFRLTALGLLVSLFVVAIALFILGETPASWLYSTLVEASAAKGGASLVQHPFHLVIDSIEFILDTKHAPAAVMLAPIVVGSAISWKLRAQHELSNTTVLVTCVYAILMFQRGYDDDSFYTLPPFVFIASVIYIFTCGTMMVVRRTSRNDSQMTLWLLSLYLFFQFVFTSLSSGGQIEDIIFPLSIFLLLVPILILDRLGPSFVQGARAGFVVLCALLAADGAWSRIRDPYSWWSFHVSPLWADYNLRYDERRGVHFIDNRLAALIDPVCARLARGTTLLSTPFSFANYYCGVPAWRGYVTTWFDLSTEAKIERLLSDLKREPPDYVLYQQQERALLRHEELYNQGRPLPYRKLHSYIRERIARGDWRVVFESRLYVDSHWLLIRTDAKGRSADLDIPIRQAR